MKIDFIAKFALKSMGYSNIRTTLTLIAIIIGIFSVSLLTGISKGTQDSVTARLQSIGTDVITIIPLQLSSGFEAGHAQFLAIKQRFVESDLRKILMVEGVKKVGGTLSGMLKVSYGDSEDMPLTIYAVPFDADQIITGVKVKEGRWLSGKSDAVMGANMESNIDEKIDVGKKMIIANRTFTVVGIMEKTGNSQARLDDMVYIPYDAGRELFYDRYGKDEVSAIIIKVKEGYDANVVGKEIEKTLLYYKKITDPKDKFFTVITPEYIAGQVSSVTGTLNLFFIAVASISIIIGLVGVGNTMYMNIIDRTKEIALMKSIGARKREIILIYILEGMSLGLLGCIIGIILGIAIGILIRPIVPFSPDFMQIGMATVTIVIGAGIASLIPAKMASEINAADALRYE
jgi:putative ABC transport system permease protein